MDSSKTKKPQLLTVLQEGVSLVQMILFKEVRALLGQKHPDRDTSYLSMLAGAITSEIFGSRNPEEKFRIFRDENRGVIEQELIGLARDLPALRPDITDALRIQTLCDSQLAIDSTTTLTRADELGVLIRDRDIPLPSTFMTMIRKLGEQHGLIIPPVFITPEDDSSIIH